MLQIIVITVLISNCRALYPQNSNVIKLTPTNFDKLVMNSDEVWLVEFFAPWCGHCQQLVPEYQKAANALKGIVKVGAVDVNEHGNLGERFAVQGLPTIKIFGVYKNAPDNYSGPRTAQGLADVIISTVQNQIYVNLGTSKSKTSDSKDVIELTDDNFDNLVLKSDDMWLVKFYAPWCSHCKSLAPHWAQAARELKGKVKLGAVDVTANKLKASKFSIQGFPTIKYFPVGKKSLSSAENYDGSRTSTDIVNWALAKLAENLPGPQLTQILDEASFKKMCEEKTLCVISILPHILECQAECRNGYLNTLKHLNKNYKKNMWGWIWMEAEAQPDLEIALDLSGFGYPVMAVLNVKKMKYSSLRGSFSKDGINEFLRDLSYGRGRTAPVRGSKLPKIVKTDPWDGKDGELPAEEDIDLLDVNLDEKDELYEF